MRQAPHDAIARANVEVGLAATEDLAAWLLGLPDDGWTEPTGCSEWNVRQLANHVGIAGRMFSDVIAPILQGETAPPAMDARQKAREEMEALPNRDLPRALQEPAIRTREVVLGSSNDQLQQMAQFPFGSMPLWAITGVAATEAVVHGWDARLGRDPGAVIPAPWAFQVAQVIFNSLPILTGAGATECPGVYLLDVGDGVGPVTMKVNDGKVTAEWGARERSNVTVSLTADHYVRLLWGRLDISHAIETGAATADDPGEAAKLNRIFPGR